MVQFSRLPVGLTVGRRLGEIVVVVVGGGGVWEGTNEVMIGDGDAAGRNEGSTVVFLLCCGEGTALKGTFDGAADGLPVTSFHPVGASLCAPEGDTLGTKVYKSD